TCQGWGQGPLFVFLFPVAAERTYIIPGGTAPFRPSPPAQTLRVQTAKRPQSRLGLCHTRTPCLCIVQASPSSQKPGPALEPRLHPVPPTRGEPFFPPGSQPPRVARSSGHLPPLPSSPG